MQELIERQEQQQEGYQEAEGVLERMAQALAPANAELRQLAVTLAAGDEAGGPGEEDGEERQRRQAQAELRKAEARYRALVEQIPAVSFMAPLDGTTSELYVSPQVEALLGFTAEEWLSNPILWYSQLHPDDQNRWQEMFARTLNAGEHFRSDYRFISRDGRVVWIHGEAKVVSDEDGRPLFLQGVAFDITETKEAEEKLRQVNTRLALARDQALDASRAKSAFLANMSHELRTPLNAIIGFSEMLTEDAESAGEETYLPDLLKIHGSAKHLLGLISGILDLSKIEAGKMDLYLETFDLGTMVREVLASVQPLVEKNRNELEVRGADGLGLMHADATKVRQVLLNLLSNASKFTEGGTVTLEAARLPLPGGDRIRLAVKDTGIGIPPEKMGRLFEAFDQGDNSTTRKYGGTGLGLVISQRFCQMMGGAITVHSEPGKGSTFVAQLPAEVAPAEGLESAPAEGGAAAAAAPDAAPALVIADDAQVRELVSRSLSQQGLRVVTASGAAEGVHLAKDLLPAVVAADLTLADMDGWAVLTALKADPALADVPVTLFATADGASRGYVLSAWDYLTRPVDGARLSALLSKYADGRGGPGRALLIDDEPETRAALGRLVAQERWSVTEAAGGLAAIKAVAEAPPDLIVLDLLGPKADGLELVRVLRRTQAGRSIPVLLVTGEELTPEDLRRLSGAVEKMLQKGALGRDELLQEVRDVVAAAVRSRPRAHTPAAPVGANGTSSGLPESQDLHRQLEQIRAERDAAMAERVVSQGQFAGQVESLRQQLREQQQTVELLRQECAELQAEPPADWAAERRRLQEDAAAARQQFREQQQTVELLQGECADLQAQLESSPAERAEGQGQFAGQAESLRQQLREQQQTVELLRQEYAELQAGPADLQLQADLRRQVEQLQAERDAALAEARRAAAPLAREPALAGRSVVPAAPARGEARAARAVEAAAPRRRPPAAGADVWHLRYQDERGKWFRGTGNTTANVRHWLGRIPLSDGARVLLSRAEGGPFEPPESYPEFYDLAPPPYAPSARAAAPERPPAEPPAAAFGRQAGASSPSSGATPAPWAKAHAWVSRLIGSLFRRK